MFKVTLVFFNMLPSNRNSWSSSNVTKLKLAQSFLSCRHSSCFHVSCSVFHIISTSPAILRSPVSSYLSFPVSYYIINFLMYILVCFHSLCQIVVCFPATCTLYPCLSVSDQPAILWDHGLTFLTLNGSVYLQAGLLLMTLA